MEDKEFIWTCYSTRNEKWKPILTYIIEKDENGCYVFIPNIYGDSDVKIKQFRKWDMIFQTRKECMSFIERYFYEELCVNCKWEEIMKKMASFSCFTCGKRNEGVCKKIVSFGKELGWRHIEVCRYYIPSSLHKKYEEYLKNVYISYNEYHKFLKNCEYNTECPLNKNSNRTVKTYKEYMEQIITIPVKGVCLENFRRIKAVKIPRIEWVDRTCFVGWKIKSNYICYDYKLNKNGQPRKEDRPTYEYFDQPVLIKMD